MSSYIHSHTIISTLTSFHTYCFFFYLHGAHIFSVALRVLMVQRCLVSSTFSAAERYIITSCTVVASSLYLSCLSCSYPAGSCH